LVWNSLQGGGKFHLSADNSGLESSKNTRPSTRSDSRLRRMSSWTASRPAKIELISAGLQEQNLPRSIAFDLLDGAGRVVRHVEDATDKVGRYTTQSNAQIIYIRNIDSALPPFCLDQKMLRFADRDQICLSRSGRFWIEVHDESVGNESRAEEFLKCGSAAGSILAFQQAVEELAHLSDVSHA